MVTLLLAGCAHPVVSDSGPTRVAAYLSQPNPSPVDSAETGDTGDSPSPPSDVDADGYLAVADGGDDCDDGDPNVHPGAEDWCDGMDADCDGFLAPDGNCAEVQPFLSRATKFNDEAIDYMMPARDLTGDGLDDLLVSIAAGGVGIAAGTGDGSGFSTWTFVAEWYEYEFECNFTGTVLDVGDIDGDGYNDVAIGHEDCGGGYDVAWGPIDGSEESLELTRWMGTGDGYLSNNKVGDVDGDGLPDLVHANEMSDSDGVVDVFFGGDRKAVTAVLTTTLGHSIASDDLGDVDGDGMGDLVVTYGGSGGWVSGSTLVRDTIVSIEDVQEGMFEEVDGADPSANDDYPPFLPIGDASGDGLGDVVYIQSETRRGSICYYDTFSGASIAPSGRLANDVVDDAIGYASGLVREGESPRMVFVYNNSDEELEQYFILPLDWYVGTGDLSAAQHLTLGNDYGGDRGAGFANAAGRGDIDGDGWTDVTARTNAGPAWSFSSFGDIPWEEDRYW